MHRRMMSVAAAGLAALAVGGCGGGDDPGADRFEGAEADVAEVIDELGAAARDGDVAKICEDLITVDLQRTVRQSSGTSCGDEFRENIVSDETRYTVDSVDVSGSRATAVITDQADRRSRVVLVKQDEGWRISSITGA